MIADSAIAIFDAMNLNLKSAREIGLMRRAGLLVWEAHQAAAELVKPGVTTMELENAIAAVFKRENAEPLFLNYPGKVPFPAVSCISVNEAVVHGIPDDRVLVEGDIISIDTGCRINGWCGDAAITHPVGKITDEAQSLLDCTSQVLDLAIAEMEKCELWSEVGQKMQTFVEERGFAIVDQFVGHGIGKDLHEDPQVPNYYDAGFVKSGKDFRLRPGVVLAIEPMINVGTKKTKCLKDHWTIVTSDGKLSAHFEHTVALTKNGAVRLTAAPELNESLS